MSTGRSTEVVRIDALVCGPDFQQLMSEPRVIAIAERIARDGEVATPIVRASDMEVMAGEDVIAAHCLLEIDELQVELVHDDSLDDSPATEFSPQGEAQCAVTEVTPAPGKVSLDDMQAMLEGRPVSREYPGMMLHDSDGSVIGPVPGPSAQTAERVRAVQTAQGVTQKAAVATVAAETGKSEHAVKKAANRAKRAKDRLAIETWGRQQPAAWMAATTELRSAMTTASNAIRTAMSALSPLLGGCAVPGADLVATYEALKDRAASLRACRPACVCAWCKNEPLLVFRCTACGGRGWLGEQRMMLVPKELFPPGSAMADGRPVELPEPAPFLPSAEAIDETRVPYEPEPAEEQDDGGMW